MTKISGVSPVTKPLGFTFIGLSFMRRIISGRTRAERGHPSGWSRWLEPDLSASDSSECAGDGMPRLHRSLRHFPLRCASDSLRFTKSVNIWEQFFRMYCLSDSQGMDLTK